MINLAQQIGHDRQSLAFATQIPVALSLLKPGLHDESEQ
jgi:hypothetical protein